MNIPSACSVKEDTEINIGYQVNWWSICRKKHSEHQKKSDFFLWELQQKYCFQIKSVLIKSLTKHDSARLLSWDNDG